MILEAIAARRPMAAQAAMHVHIDKLIGRFLDLELDPELAGVKQDHIA